MNRFHGYAFLIIVYAITAFLLFLGSFLIISPRLFLTYIPLALPGPVGLNIAYWATVLMLPFTGFLGLWVLLRHLGCFGYEVIGMAGFLGRNIPYLRPSDAIDLGRSHLDNARAEFSSSLHG